MSVSSVTWKLQPLKFGSNTPDEFPSFKAELTLLLVSQELFDEILPPRPAGMRPSEVDPLYRSHGYVSTKAKNAKALLLIIQSLDKTLNQSIPQKSKETARDLWLALCARYERDTEQQKQSLNHALDRTKLKEDESVSDYVGRLMNIFNRLAAVGSEVPVERQRLHFINGLTSDYRTVIDALNVSAAKEPLDVWIRHVEDKYEKLVIEKEQKKKEESARLAKEKSEEEEKAAYVQMNTSNSQNYRGGGISGYRGGFNGNMRRGGYRGRGRFNPYGNRDNNNRFRNNNFRNNQQYNNGDNNNHNSNAVSSSSASGVHVPNREVDMRNNTCFNCHKFGHIARECRQRNNNNNY